jgi:hypothetical protein
MRWPWQRNEPEEVQIRYVGELQRLELPPGDKFVLICPAGTPITQDMAERLKQTWENFAGEDHPCAVITDGMKLGVISAPSAESGLRFTPKA